MRYIIKQVVATYSVYESGRTNPNVIAYSLVMLLWVKFVEGF